MGKRTIKVLALFISVMISSCEVPIDSDTLQGLTTDTNQAPTIDVSISLSVAENSTLNVDLVASDPDGDPLTFSCDSGCPAGMSITNGSGSGLITWTPGFSDDGDYPIVLVADDGTTQTFKSITVTVSNTNRAPVIDAISSQSIGENETATVTPTATDPDGDALTFSVTSTLPSNASFDGTSLTFSPDYTQSGVYTFDFEVTDGDLTDTESMSITVNDVNQAPVLDTIGPITYPEASAFYVYPSGSDPEGSPTTITATNLPTGATWNGSTNEFYWSTGTTDEGSYDVTFTISDGDLTDSEIVTITITHVDFEIPTWDTAASIVSQSGSTGTINIGSAHDPDGLSVSYYYIREYDCKDRDWTETWDETGPELTITQGWGNDSTNPHFFIVYVEDADGSRNYRQLNVGYVSDAYHISSQDFGSSFPSTNYCGAGTTYNHGPN